ncbi:MAG TPA: ABC transporter permease [Candidatus Polarisedimenticolia bacterium]|nr:ABC transporter permease [Candidatus Polarisedimenticolia bacterium]
MARRILHRACLSAATLLVVTALVHAAASLLPRAPLGGDGPGDERPITPASPASPPPVLSYPSWLAGLTRLDLGRSTAVEPGRPVSAMIAAALPFSLLLGGAAFGLSMALALPLAAAASWRPGSPGLRAADALVYILHALPVFWLALLLQNVAAVRLRILPLMGAGPLDPADQAGFSRAAHWVLPVAALGLGSLAFAVRLAGGALKDASRARFAQACRARGAGDARILMTHGMASAAVPLVSLASMLLPALVSGSVVVESIFALPGMGRLFLLAALRRDEPLLTSIALLSAAATLAAGLAAEILSSALDPRARRQDEASS